MDGGRIVAMGSPRELIAAHIEPQVVEVYGENATIWARSDAARLSERCEVSGETAFCYLHEAKPLLADLDVRAGLRYLHRPANLEDVFLKLTGRELRD
jgi:lipooligosaccharide transport system ATP-binding protein